MDLKDNNISLQFYNYLCKIVGSDEVVRTRREIFTVKDIVQTSAIATPLSSGSKAGLDLKGSDYDQMILYNFFRVYESSNDVEYCPCKILSVMEINDTKPGFTNLKLSNKSDVGTDMIQDWCETVGEKTYISSKRFREDHLRDNMVIHGPCVSSPGGEYDVAICFRCEKWITTAEQWIHRSRTTWPHYTLVTAAVECYALMKIILKDLIKPRHGDLLCSYFLKTIIFWLSEETNPSEWKPENMISCFLDCIRRLVYCVEYKTCLHYFIPENILFADRFTGNDHKALLDTLRFVYGSPWTSVFYTDTFLNYKLQSINSHWMALSASLLSCFLYIKLIHNNRSM